jgi:A/G-specific adenine glycosylase
MAANIPNPVQFRTRLLKHFKAHARALPWRQNRTPYSIWLAEIMLQQTTVTAVTDYYHTFLQRFPTLVDLAKADLQEIFHLWQGLGYYSRARNLHACAKVLVAEHNASFPTSAAQLQKLPGIGPYTAGAIAAIAFHENTPVVDGNVERVISRVCHIQTPLPKSKPEIKSIVTQLTDPTEPGNFAEAMMDLGATICTPRTPKCDICPLKELCRAYSACDAEKYPKKAPKTAKPAKHGSAFVIRNNKNALYLVQRPATGLLASLWETPSTGWEKEDRFSTLPPALQAACTKRQQTAPSGTIRHIFTHFSLTLDVYDVTVTETQGKNWFKPAELPPISNLIKKVLAH